ncbi:acetyl-CoA carboxylase biotin carboxylase subunit [Bacillus dakarensis]|uniref:acetyl-CoA carboxylase biotin carboxylase subunit n=1 Tax=Robertmurraya dakarensis TaxID=1926278 RepID=UPI0009808E20|nr:acetyl-CoA carboxylase biotin carboxylase subunit [Bacillus dakarensis]
MFSKVLIANRGEIALRIMKTCKKLGIKTVAIYSEADAGAVFVRHADESYCVGKPPVHQSYLNADEIIAIAISTKAEAVHPGYGLLSENASFAKKCKDAGLVFIGPNPEIIASMGSKIEARKMMQAAGVPVIEGVDLPLENEEEAVTAAAKIGYPLMLKASAGGGGIGMQLVHSEEELRKAFSGNKKRAQSFFGDGAMFIEKYIEEPHHIEVQIIADQYGHVIPLWERECSVQRRHQKVVEEAPSPFINEETREKMLEAAVKAAKHIGYSNAGTIEFLVDKKQNFYFLEMNTRLQVEHGVTEEITGLDLVEEQLKIASGKRLSFSRQDVERNGHAIEVRIYAEDPVRFFPSPGTIKDIELPQGEGIRHDIAVEAGSEVTPFYDPMIGKLIVWGETRKEACNKMNVALNKYKIEGIKTNLSMLKDIISHDQFIAGMTTTDFVNKHYLPKLKQRKE